MSGDLRAKETERQRDRETDRQTDRERLVVAVSLGYDFDNTSMRYF